MFIYLSDTGTIAAGATVIESMVDVVINEGMASEDARQLAMVHLQVKGPVNECVNVLMEHSSDDNERLETKAMQGQRLRVVTVWTSRWPPC